MPFWRFTVLTTLGCIPWVFALMFIGKQAGDRWEDWKENLHYIDYAVIAVIVIGAVWLFVRYRRRRGASAAAVDAAEGRSPELAQVVALGLIQGATELLPVSSSAHIAARAAAAGLGGGRVGAGAAQGAGGRAARRRARWRWRPALWRLRPDVRTLALSLAPPVIAGYLLERPIEERLGGPGGARRRPAAGRPR